MAEKRKPGGQPGNQNGVKGRMWRNAIMKALEKRSKSRADAQFALNEIAEQLVSLASIGDLAALKELGDRIEGKAAQSVTLLGDDENPIAVTSITRRVIMPGDVSQDKDDTDEDGVSFF